MDKLRYVLSPLLEYRVQPGYQQRLARICDRRLSLLKLYQRSFNVPFHTLWRLVRQLQAQSRQPRIKTGAFLRCQPYPRVRVPVRRTHGRP